MPRSKRARPQPKVKRKASPKREPVQAPPSVRELARRLGLARTTVKDGLDAGRCPKGAKRDAKGRWQIVDIDLAVREWYETASRPSPAIAPTNGNGNGSETGSLNQAQQRLALERTESLKLARLQKQGRLIDRAVAAREAFDIARTVRDSILGVPDRISAELAAETDQARVHRRLEEELRGALSALAEVLAGEATHAEPGTPDGDHGRDGDALR